MSGNNAWRVIWRESVDVVGQTDKALADDVAIVVAKTSTEAVARLLVVHGVDHENVEAVERFPVDIILPPAPAPRLPARVLVLRRASIDGTLAVATSRASLAHLIHDDDRGDFVAGRDRTIWRSSEPAHENGHSHYVTLDEAPCLQ